MSPLAAVCSVSDIAESALNPLLDGKESLSEGAASQSALKKEIVFIDAGVEDPEQLAAGVVEQAEAYILQGDAVTQITTTLKGRNDIANIHIISHGSPGCLHLGDRELSLDTLEQYAPQLKTWFSAATSPELGSLLLYGCNVAAGDAGEEFIHRLHAIIGHPISAATQRVGHPDAGGQWQLKAYFGEPQALAIAAATQATYRGAFPEITSFTATPTAGEEAGQTTIRLEVTADANVTSEQVVELGLKLSSTATGSDFESLAPGTITIPNGSDTGFIEFSIKDDEIVEGRETAIFTLGNPSADLTIASTAREVSVDITDNEVPQVNLTINTTSGTETSTPGETEIVLTAEATQAVQGDQELEIALTGVASAADFRLETGFPATLTILDGQRTGELSFPIKDDALVEYLETATFTLTQPATTTGVVLGPSVEQTLEITDNDFPELSLVLSTSSASEDGPTTITVTPTASEAVQGDQTAELVLDGIQTADFTGNIPATVTIPDGSTTGTPFTLTVVDDALVEGTETGTFTLSNPSAQIALEADPNYGFAIADNEFPTVTLSVDTTAASEDALTPITVTANASQAVEGDQTVDLALSGAQALDFTGNIPANLTILDGQTTASFSIAVADDVQVEGLESATFTLSNPSAGLTLGSPNLITQIVDITDNDFPTVALDVTPTSATEADQTQVTVTVTASEAVTTAQTVQLDLTGDVSATDFVVAPPTQLTIPAGQSSASVTLSINDDVLVEDPETATFTLSNPSSGIKLDSPSEITKTVSIADNDLPVIDLSIDQTAATEGGAATFSLTVTSSEPVDGDQSFDIVISGADAADFASPFPATLMILDGQTTSTLNQAVVDDALIEGTENVTFALQNPSAGVTLGTTTTANLAIADNDFPQVDLSANVTTASELDATAITLTATAEAPVEGDQTVSLALSGDALSADFSAAVPTQLTILDGQTIASVTFAVQDDDLIETAEIATFEISQPSNGLILGATTSVDIEITDNDTAGFILAETDGATEVNEAAPGNTDSFTVQLMAQPDSAVTIDIAGEDPTAATLSATSLTFLPTDWDLPQTVTVTGVDNDTIEADTTTTLMLSVNDALSDDSFDPVVDQTLDITTFNDDQAGFEITESSSSTVVSETGTTDSFEVVLTAQPSSAVTLNITSDATDEVTVDTATLTFLPTDWGVPQTVTVTGVDDTEIDGNQTTNVTLTVDAGASDDNFDNLASQSVAVTTTDDDEPGITITPTSGLTVTEDQGTATFEVVLNKQPSAAVTINLSNGDDSEASVSETALNFLPTDWDLPQTVTVTGVDDLEDDRDVTFTIATTVISDDAGYAALDPDDVTVTNTDNDENTAPVLTTEIEDQAAQVDTAFSFSVSSATFADADPWDTALAYSATLVGGGNLPAWMSFDADSLTFSGTPTAADEGSVEVTVLATDTAGLYADDTFAIAVEAQPTPAPSPNPAPAPAPTPTPATNPSPTPNPGPAPAPAPAPAPTPDPLPAPSPLSTPLPSPDPTTDPATNPISDPTPTPTPDPLPTPSPLSTPVEPVMSFNLSLLQGQSNSVNELIVVATDDLEGRINGLLPEDAGYEAAFLDDAQVLFSTLMSDRLPGLETSRTVNLLDDSQFRFALIKDGSLDSLLQNGVGELKLAVTPDGREIIEASTLSVEGAQLSLQIPGDADFGDIILANSTGSNPPLGSGLQGNGAEAEMFDFRGETGTKTATFEVYRDAAYDNLVGFYFVENEQGQVRDSLGALLNPGDEGYAAAALANRLPDVNLAGQNGSVETFTAEIAMGQLLSSFIIVDGTVEQLLDADVANNPNIYFNHVGANGDRTDHIRLIGDNTFGFEDLVNGGDMDFDDIVVSMKIA